jgi:hypothetical protein
LIKQFYFDSISANPARRDHRTPPTWKSAIHTKRSVDFRN